MIEHSLPPTRTRAFLNNADRSPPVIRLGNTDVIVTAESVIEPPRPANASVTPMTYAQGWAQLQRMQRQILAKQREPGLTWEQWRHLRSAWNRLQRLQQMMLRHLMD